MRKVEMRHENAIRYKMSQVVIFRIMPLYKCPRLLRHQFDGAGRGVRELLKEEETNE